MPDFRESYPMIADESFHLNPRFSLVHFYNQWEKCMLVTWIKQLDNYLSNYPWLTPKVAGGTLYFSMTFPIINFQKIIPPHSNYIQKPRTIKVNFYASSTCLKWGLTENWCGLLFTLQIFIQTWHFGSVNQQQQVWLGL